MLLPKDLLEDLEGGDRTEEIIKKGLEIKLERKLELPTSTFAFTPEEAPCKYPHNLYIFPYTLGALH